MKASFLFLFTRPARVSLVPPDVQQVLIDLAVDFFPYEVSFLSPLPAKGLFLPGVALISWFFAARGEWPFLDWGTFWVFFFDRIGLSFDTSEYSLFFFVLERDFRLSIQALPDTSAAARSPFPVPGPPDSPPFSQHRIKPLTAPLQTSPVDGAARFRSIFPGYPILLFSIRRPHDSFFLWGTVFPFDFLSASRLFSETAP